MSENVTRFTGRVENYADYREPYNPDVVLPLLRDWCVLAPSWTIADIGAGTGMLSDVFLANGNHVTALEPNDEMRAACADLHQSNPLLHLTSGTAENTGFADASIDMVAVGRALHWFDLHAAMQEFRRILKPGGWIAVIALGRAQDRTPANSALNHLLHPFTDGHQGVRRSYAAYQQMESIFAGGAFHQAEIPSEIHLGWEQFRGLMLSYSHSPLPSAPGFQNFEDSLREFFSAHQASGVLTLATQYRISAGQWPAATGS